MVQGDTGALEEKESLLIEESMAGLKASLQGSPGTGTQQLWILQFGAGTFKEIEKAQSRLRQMQKKR